MDDGTRLARESIWRVYQDLRRLAPQMLAEEGSVLYLPMTACDDRVDGFSSARTQRQVGVVWCGCLRVGRSLSVMSACLRGITD